MGCCYDTPPWAAKKSKARLPASLIGFARLLAAAISFTVSGYAIINFDELTTIKILIMVIFMALAWAIHSDSRRSAAWHDRENKQAKAAQLKTAGKMV
ncbi:MAG: hypothetical protein OEY01_04050 [Desulfobulbaceae bacterium]|nr:hypothetical protein [Desulfobulbaceae bacterium]HIJ78356.1 hypothetical protein [Deltaproteobacteria bacterium]